MESTSTHMNRLGKALITDSEILSLERIVAEVDAVEAEGGAVRGTPGAVAPEKIVAALVEAGVGVREFTVTSPSLEDLFVALTGEGFDVSG